MSSIARTPHVVFVDLQEGLITAARTQPEKELRSAVAAFGKIANALSWPCLASTIPAGPGLRPPLVSELASTLPAIDVHERAGFDAFAHEPTRQWLQAGSASRIAIAGVATEVAVLCAALSARAAGHEVHVIIDACSGLSRRTEDAAIRQMEAAGIITSSVASFASMHVKSIQSTEGFAVLGALQSLMG